MRLGTTAFSFTNEWLSRKYTLEQLLARVAELGLGPGIELVGFQAWRRYPALPDAEVLAFRRLVEDLGLEPAALGAYADLARRPDRLMTTVESVEFLVPQIAVAEALGFPLLRLHGGIPAAVIEQLVPTAERAGVTLATEVQGGQAPDSPGIVALLESHERLDSANVGLVLDFSVSMTALPTSFVESVCRLGVRREELDEIATHWVQGAPAHELFAALAEVDAPAAALDEARAGFVRFGRQGPQAWLPLVPQIVYAHAKFCELDATGADPTVRTAELIDVLQRGGYSGYVSSEWGGRAGGEQDGHALGVVG